MYTKRPGAYAIITRKEDDKIGIVTANNKYFYLGGGIEIGETPLEALKRESIEEIGYTLKSLTPYKIINSYEHGQKKGYIDVTANVYLVELDKKVAEPIEDDHEFLWIQPKEYLNKMYFNWHNYILNCYVEDYIK